METRKTFDVCQDLPGTQPGSDLQSIYIDLMNGKTLSSLDAVRSNHTVNLTKYVSVLRKRYGIDIKDKWIKIPNSRKRVKLYWIES